MEQLKSQAVEEQDFELAQRIKKELESRKSVTELLKAREAELAKAVQEDDFDEAEALKTEIQRLRDLQKQLATLEKNLEKAVAAEDYASAQALKEEQGRLRKSLYEPAAVASPDESAPVGNMAAQESVGTTGTDLSASGSAQALSFPAMDKISFKVTGGLTFGDARFTSDDASNDLNKYGPKIGMVMAMSVQYQLSESVSAHASMGFLNFGIRTKEADYHYRMNYLSSELMGRMAFAYGAYGAAGVFVDYGLWGRQRMPSGNKVPTFSGGGLHRLNAGLSGEGGWSLQLAGYQGELFLSYHLALTNIEGKYNSDNQKTRLRMLTVGGRFYL